MKTITSNLRPATATSYKMPLAKGNFRFSVHAYNAAGESPASAKSNLVAAR